MADQYAQIDVGKLERKIYKLRERMECCTSKECHQHYYMMIHPLEVIRECLKEGGE